MKTIGLLGGMSWESTELYYRWINEGIKARLGGLHSAHIVTVSVDFQEIKDLQYAGDWQKAGVVLAQSAQQIEAAGADCLLICTNTMHKVAPQIADAINIPIIHIADATAHHIKAKHCDTIGLLGTKFTMQQDFYKERLQAQGIDVITPHEADQEIIHTIIYDELCLGKINPHSRQAYLRIMQEMHARGAQGIIEGCTEIVMLVQQEHTDMPLFDTTAIHAEAAVNYALG